jgi:uncharacterized cupredoxin-like copper-binding protein
VKTAVLALFLAALLFAAAGSATTQPSKKVTIAVIIDDSKIQVQQFSQVGVGPTATLTAMGGPIPRGNYLSFNIFNNGKKVHNFTVLGKKTKAIKPKGKAHLFIVANTRGNFVWKSTLDKGKRFQGHLVVA